MYADSKDRLEVFVIYFFLARRNFSLNNYSYLLFTRNVELYEEEN